MIESTDSEPRAIGEIPRAEPIDGALHLAGFHVVARYESIEPFEQFLGYRTSSFGKGRRALIRWLPRARPDWEPARQQLAEQARALALLDHPNIVRLLECGEDAHGAFLALEHAPGVDLLRVCNRLARRGERMPFEQALYLTVEVTRALDHAQRFDLVHGDLSPARVLISAEGHVRLSELGAPRIAAGARIADAQGPLKSRVRFMAPESFAAGHAHGSARGDVYSLGVMLFEMLLGAPWVPQRASTTVLLTSMEDGLPLARLEGLGLCSEIRGLVAMATDRDPQRRFASAREMCAAAESWLIRQGFYVSPSILAGFLRTSGLLTEADLYVPQL